MHDTASTQRELVHARIVIAGDRYDVFARGAEADLVRFTLHYYARVLYELVRTCHSVRDLPARIDAITAVPLDIFASAGTGESLLRGDRTLDCSLVARRARDYELVGDLSALDARMLRGSMLAVLQNVARMISPEMRTHLATALMNMNASYGVTHRYADPRSLAEVPTTAFSAASFV